MRLQIAHCQLKGRLPCPMRADDLRGICPNALEGLATKKLNLARRVERRRDEVARERTITLQVVERIASALILPHTVPEAAEVRRLKPNPQTEDTAMRVAMEYEQAAGRAAADLHEKDLGYDLTSLDTKSGELRLIEIKGIGAADGTVVLTPNEHRVAQDRRDCYWLYVVMNRDFELNLTAIDDPARLGWHEVTEVAHYRLEANAMTPPSRRQGDSPLSGGRGV